MADIQTNQNNLDVDEKKRRVEAILSRYLLEWLIIFLKESFSKFSLLSHKNNS